MAYNFKFFLKKHLKEEFDQEEKPLKVPELNKTFLGFKGAIDRTTFGIFSFLVIGFYFFLFWLLKEGAMTTFFVLALPACAFHFFFFAGLCMRRMADIVGYENSDIGSGVALIIVFTSFPIINIAFFLYLLFRKGVISGKE